MSFGFLHPLPSSPGWKRWVGGSGNDARDHLAIEASPRPTTAAKLVNGPAWYPGQRVEPLAPVAIGNWDGEEVFVPPKLNDGSMFMHHIVFVWTQEGHTYGVGFHDLGDRKRTTAMNAALMAWVRLVQPPG
jgi:hypothetical protein